MVWKLGESRTYSGVILSSASELNSEAKQPMISKAYYAHSSIRDCWALGSVSRCPKQVVRLKRDPQCLSPQEPPSFYAITFRDIDDRSRIYQLCKSESVSGRDPQTKLARSCMIHHSQDLKTVNFL
ncbi:hypothetical protein TNCV_268211 [Trichonephila clavipes]|nr:hypothetical protein TNCV_268211 [Trichonephila clavipes]